MEFPFKFKHAFAEHDIIFTADKLNNKLKITWVNGGGYEQTSTDYSFAHAQKYIDEGTWIVQKPVEAPVEPSVEVSKLTFKVESEGAVAAVKELTEAIDELGYAYSKLIEIQSRFKGN